MDIVVLRLSSPDLDAAIGEMPEDAEHFRVEVEAMLAPAGHDADDVTFVFTVVSPAALRSDMAAGFITNTLVLPEFSWPEVRSRIDRLLMHTRGCTTWECVAYRLAGHMRPIGVTFNAL